MPLLNSPRLWSIPAYAGEPRAICCWPAPPRVYPRVCGGTLRCSSCGGAPSGLSPRMRGNRARSVSGRHRRGSIPAYAGEPPSTKSDSSLRRVYPRVCGGTRRHRVSAAECQGLSPRMRGNRGQRSLCHAVKGLSPRMRGNRGPAFALSCRQRSIPAYAGEPGYAQANEPIRWVYPRVCGGTEDGELPQQEVVGLSPRMRGNPCLIPLVLDNVRSIPAYAGEPLHHPVSGHGTEVYPRVCGGTVLQPYRGGLPLDGLSPRMRGNPGGALATG